MSGHVKWSEIRAEHVARAGGEAAVEAGRRELRAEVVRAAEDHIQGGSVTEDLEPASVVGRFPWQCPHCGHHRDDHTGPVPTPAVVQQRGAGPGSFGTCTDCPSCTGPDRR